MITRYLLAALCAGLVAGLLVTPLHYARVVPLIVAAETYETAEGHTHVAFAEGDTASDAPRLILAHSTDQEGEHGDEGGLPRFAGTLLANLVTGAGFALLLAGASLLLGRPLTRANGVLWGLAGFGIVALAPALGLPPELPAMPAADLGARQVWWWGTVIASAAGLWLILRPQMAAKAGGVALILLPHLVGAPHPAELASPVPPTLAAEFAVASLATAAAFWVGLGLLLGLAFDRLRPAA